MKVFILLPTHQEKHNLERLVPWILDTMGRLDDVDHDIIIIDDASTDGTVEVASKFATEIDNVHAILRPEKLGLGNAYRAGFSAALAMGADVIVEMDADTSHRPEYLPIFLDHVRKKKNGLVIGSRYCKGGDTVNWSAWRKVVSKAANHLTALMLGVFETRDMTSGFRAFTRASVQAMNHESMVTNGYAWQIETALRVKLAGFSIVEIPIIFWERCEGRSKLGKKDIIEFLTFLLRAVATRFLHRVSLKKRDRG